MVLRSKKFISMLLAMIMVLSIACLSASAETQIDTTSRGYQLIDGDVYDLDNNLLIKMDNGFTGDGYTLDPNFTVYYPSNLPVDKDKFSESSTKATDIFDGTADLPLNVDGNQGVYLGGYFTLSSSEPNVFCEYSSGQPSGVNFTVYNETRNTCMGWVSNVQPDKSKIIKNVYNSLNPDDQYRVKASAEGSAGTAT